MGSVNLRADIETEKFRETIKKMEDDRADLVSAIVKLKTSINELKSKRKGKTFRGFSIKLIKNLMRFIQNYLMVEMQNLN